MSFVRNSECRACSRRNVLQCRASLVPVLKVTEFIATVNLRLLNSGKLEDPKSGIFAQNDGGRIRTQISFPSIILPLFSVNLLHSSATNYKTEMKTLMLLVPKASKPDRGSPWIAQLPWKYWGNMCTLHLTLLHWWSKPLFYFSDSATYLLHLSLNFKGYKSFQSTESRHSEGSESWV